MMDHIKELDSHSESQLQDIHDKFVRFADEKKKKLFEAEYGKEYNNIINLSKQEVNKSKKLSEEFNNKQIEVLKRYDRNPKDAEPYLRRLHEKYNEEMKKIRVDRDRMLSLIQEMPAPERFISTDQFTKEKLSETVANSALYAYNKYKEKAPVIAIENVFPDWTLGRAESLKEAVEKSREKFAMELHKNKNVSKEKAKEIAGKFI